MVHDPLGSWTIRREQQRRTLRHRTVTPPSTGHRTHHDATNGRRKRAHNVFRTSSPRALAHPLLAGLLLLAGATVPPAGAAATCEHVDAVVTVQWDRDRASTASGVVARIQYPASLDVATDPKDGSARARVTLLTSTPGGLFDALKKDTDGDGAANVLSVGLITAGIAPGPFARIRFDCRPGSTAPPAAALSCVADVADESGTVPSTCSVSIADR